MTVQQKATVQTPPSRSGLYTGIFVIVFLVTVGGWGYLTGLFSSTPAPEKCATSLAYYLVNRGGPLKLGPVTIGDKPISITLGNGACKGAAAMMNNQIMATIAGVLMLLLAYISILFKGVTSRRVFLGGMVSMFLVLILSNSWTTKIMAGGAADGDVLAYRALIRLVCYFVASFIYLLVDNKFFGPQKVIVRPNSPGNGKTSGQVKA